MPAKKYSVEQIVAKLREHEKLQGQGLTIPQACKRIGISDQTFYRWRLKYGALKEDEAQRLKALEQEEQPAEANRGRPDPRSIDVEGPPKVKMVSPARCREAVRHLVRRFRVSERRACRLLDLHRSIHRYLAIPADYEKRLVKRLGELAAEHPKWGYRVMTTLLQGEGWRVNRKRVARLWRQEGNRVLPRRSKASGKKAEGHSGNARWKLRAKHPHHIWGMEFMRSRTRRGGSIRILNIVDEFTRLALGGEGRLFNWHR
jgi:hypothetical protein